MNNNVFLGFDTSNYTTSAALADENGRILANIKVPLSVKEGERGLRQSDAVFSHTVNFPHAAEALRESINALPEGDRIAACAFSASPRSTEGSYMPCFLVGQAIGNTVGAVLGVPVYKTSHQVGHIMAALYSAASSAGADPLSFLTTPFIALHVSGGTTDMLMVTPSKERVFDIQRIGGTIDANAGQIVDRVGVKMGIRFPCGGELDKLAMQCRERVSPLAGGRKLSVKGTEFNLSGLENRAYSMIDSGEAHQVVAAFVFEFIARTIEESLKNAFSRLGKLPVIFAGGVMCSEYIRCILSEYGMFSEPCFSSDNAAGVALTAAQLYAQEEKR